MSDNPAAKAARKVLEDRHRAEVEAANKRTARYKAVSIIVWIFSTLVFLGSCWISYEAKQPWRVSEPPANQPVRLVVICYKGKDGVWKSYAEGHPVQPAKEWMWKPTWKP